MLREASRLASEMLFGVAGLSIFWGREARDGRAPAAGLGRRVCPTLDESGARENRAHDLALRARAFAVNDPHEAESQTMGLL